MSHTQTQAVTYYNGHVIEVNGKRYVPERTCTMEYSEDFSNDELYPTVAYSCSKCNEVDLDGKPNYCRGCGAKVVGCD